MPRPALTLTPSPRPVKTQLSTTRRPCNDKCQYARGPDCNCKCDGLNHGIGWIDPNQIDLFEFSKMTDDEFNDAAENYSDHENHG